MLCNFFIVNTRGKKYVLVTYFIILGCSCTGQFDCNQSLFFLFTLFLRGKFIYLF